MTIGELIFEVGFKADTMKLKDFGKSVSELNLTSILAAGSFGTLYEGAKALIGIADDMALGINKFGRETGQSTQEIQKWTKVAEQMGVSADVVTGTVAGLEDSIFKMKFTGENSNLWNMLGLDPRKTSNMFDVLTMLRSKLKDMSTEQQRFFLERLGISTEMLNMFKMTDQEWGDIGKQMVLSTTQLDTMQDYHKSLIQDGENLKMIFADLGVALEPTLKALVDMLNSFDLVVLKSWEFKGVLDTIAQIMEHLAHPFKTFSDAAKAIPEIGQQWQEEGETNKLNFNSSADLFKMSLHDKFMRLFSPGYGINPVDAISPNALSLSPGDSKPSNVTVNVKTTVKSNDPNTQIETTSDQGSLNSTIRNVVNQKSAGST